VSDLAVQRLVELAIAELGPAPEGFAFLAMGSEGRQEQTSGSDQDNALLFRTADARSYFLSMGEKVCGWLDGMGVPFCRGGIMARNPAWCAPGPVWQGYFAQWIREPEPEQLLDCNVFFDFRCVAGDPSLADELRAYVEGVLAETPAFFLHLAGDLLHKKLPPHQPRPGQGELDVKDAMAPIAGFARLYALRHGIRTTNTLQRLEALREGGVLKPSSAEDIVEAWTFLLELRMRLTAGTNVDIRALGRTEEAALRHALSELSLIHRKIAFDFPGSALS
jgi:CBS domain-containing protein